MIRSILAAELYHKLVDSMTNVKILLALKTQHDRIGETDKYEVGKYKISKYEMSEKRHLAILKRVANVII